MTNYIRDWTKLYQGTEQVDTGNSERSKRAREAHQRFEALRPADQTVPLFTSPNYVKDVCPDYSRMSYLHRWGDIMSRSGLNFRDREIADIATIAAVSFEDGLKPHMIRRGPSVGISPEEIIEIVLNVAQYTGWPAGDEILSLVEECYPGFLKEGKRTPIGNSWSRPVLSTRDRAISTLAALMTRRFSDRLKTHMSWVIDMKILSKEEILEMILDITRYCGWIAGANAVRVAKDVFSSKQ